MSATTPNTQASTPAPDTIQRLQANVPPAFAMLAGMQLEVFTHLAGGPRDVADLAKSLGVSDERLSRLYALVVCGLLERRKDGFANTPEAATFLVKASPDISAVSIDEMATMLRGMHSNALSTAREFLRRFDFSQCHSVVDVGGGSGGLVGTLCDAHPGLRGTLFDLPRTAALAAAILKNAPGGDRVLIEAGDIFVAPPREIHDAVIMRSFVQVLAPGDAARAIANAAASLRVGGTIYIAGGGILDDDRLAPREAVFWNLTFMNLYPAGASYTEAEHAEWLSAVGCGNLQRVTLPSGAGIISATKFG